MQTLKSKFRSQLKKLRSSILISGVSLALVAVYPSSVKAQSSAPSPSESKRMVEVLGSSTRVMTLGLEERNTREPVLVLQSGALAPMEYWGPLIPLISKIAPLVAYDRPGIGGSALDGIDPTPDHVVHHMHELLSVLKVPPPYILVGHSWGGPLILYYAGRYPDEVVGMVYIDPSDPMGTEEDFYMISDKDEIAKMKAERDALINGALESNPGALAEYKVATAFDKTPIGDRALPEQPRVPTAFVLAALFENPGALSFMDETWHKKWIERRINRFWDYAQSLPQATLMAATDAGHNLHLTAPGLVAEAIRRVKEQQHTAPPKAPVRRTEIDIPAKILEDYVGEYELGPGAIFTITTKDNKLFSHLTGQQTLQIYPESESKFFYKVVDAQISFVRNAEGVVTHLILHQGGMDQKAYKRKKPGVRLHEHKEIKLEPEVLKKYVGKYSLGPGAVITVTLGNGTLMAQLTGQQNFPVYAESETRFFYKVVDAQIEFKLNANGEVEGLTLFQLGRELYAGKI